MTSRISKLAVAGLLVVSVSVLGCAKKPADVSTKSAWTIEQAGAAVKEYRAIHVVGAIAGRAIDSWMRSNKAMTHSQEVVARDSGGGVAWVKDGSTYVYDPGQNTVYVENAITQGFAQWLGPELLEMFAQAKGAQLFYGKDPATGRDRVTLLCSLVSVEGPQSWRVEFDLADKLPVCFTCWQNLDRSAPPLYDITQITYYRELPDGLFDVHLPGNPAHVDKPLTIPEESLSLLYAPEDGLPTEGLTQTQAAEKTVRACYQAVIGGDLAQFRKLCPLCKTSDDETLRALILKTGQASRVVEIAKLGPIRQMGESDLGPLVVVAAVLRRADGTQAEEKTIVQFRHLGGRSSCVIYGPYGVSRDVE